MSLRLANFAKTNSENNINGRRGSQSSDDESYGPPRKRSISDRRSMDRRSRSPRRGSDEEDVKGGRFRGPNNQTFNEISVRYATNIEGYCEDSHDREAMEAMGLPTNFNQGGGYQVDEGSIREKIKKGEKKTYYCEVCLIELNSEDTMNSHIKGVKHMKKKMAIQQQRDSALSRGEKLKAPEPTIKRIENPEPTKKKVPIRLTEKIKETMDPVVGLKYITETIAVSDAEMEPSYECKLCGNKGIANGMFSHIMGHKHRQKFVDDKYGDDPRYIQLSQKELLQIAQKYSENEQQISRLITTIHSDEKYPWPAGKAPWSIEKGGTGIVPDNARDNWAKNGPCKTENGHDDEYERKPLRRNSGMSPRGTSSYEQKPTSYSLPTPEILKPPKDSQEIFKYAVLAYELSKHVLDSIKVYSRKEKETVHAHFEKMVAMAGQVREVVRKRSRSISKTRRSPSPTRRREISPSRISLKPHRSESTSRGYERKSAEEIYDERPVPPMRRRSQEEIFSERPISPSRRTPPYSRRTPSHSRRTPPPSRRTPPPSKRTPPPSRRTPPPSRRTPPPSRRTPPPSRRTPPPSRRSPSFERKYSHRSPSPQRRRISSPSPPVRYDYQRRTGIRSPPRYHDVY